MKSTRAAQFFEISDIQSRNGRKDACYENQEVGGSNPLAPTTSFGSSNLRHKRRSTSAWRKTMRSTVRRDHFVFLKFNNFMPLP